MTERQLRLQQAMAEKVCVGTPKKPGCGVKGQWKITHTDYPIRWLKCKVCGLTTKIALR